MFFFKNQVERHCFNIEIYIINENQVQKFQLDSLDWKAFVGFFFLK